MNCRRCGFPQNVLNQCVEFGGHDMSPTLEELEQQIIALRELVESKQYIQPAVQDTRPKSVLDE